MLSKPLTWTFSHGALRAELPTETKHSIQAMVNSLKKLGYLRIVQERVAGQIASTTWYVYDTPYPGLPDSGKSDAYKKKKAAPGSKSGGQPEGKYHYDQDAGEWRCTL